MMDFHILIVIACVFLASLFSLLFINKFLRRKTFEEVIAEKKAMTEKIYGKEKNVPKKPKKQSLKKEMRREKKQRNKEQPDDSDAQSEQASIEDEPQEATKAHVEFEPDPEVVTFNNQAGTRRSSNGDKENLSKQSKNKKDKKASSKPGILINKNEPAKETATSTEAVPAATNHFDVKPPKDVIELKKAEKKEEKVQQLNKKDKGGKKAENRQIPDKAPGVENVQPAASVEATIVKEVKQAEDKARNISPKPIQQKAKQTNKKQKDSKEIAATLEKLSESDSVGVNLLMNLFRRAELNRSEIQILIDYLLNRQQDMPASHSEWSDDICQKLKRQLEEKEKALLEEQEASSGIQAKLRELRLEINTERATLNSTVKSYADKLQSKDQEIALLEQKIKTLHDNLSLERQQFQAKLMHEKQSGSQDILAQLQIMQNELAHKDKCIAELTCIVNASRQAVEESQQKNDIIQTQAQQLRAMEQQRDELEQVSNNRIFELEKAKQLEAEVNDLKQELVNTQNALETVRSANNQGHVEMDALKNELSLVRSKELSEKQQEIESLHAKNADLMKQLQSIASKNQEQYFEQNNLQSTVDSLKNQLAEKERQLMESETFKSKLQNQLSSIETDEKSKSVELQKTLENLKEDFTSKTKNQKELETQIASLTNQLMSKEIELQEKDKLIGTVQVEESKKAEELRRETAKQYSNREKELLQQLQEQKEKNNDLRTKNWKLVEALQNAEAKVSKQSQDKFLVQQAHKLGQNAHAAKDENQVRNLLQRLCPEAVKACAGSALSVSFDQWVEMVLASHVKQQQQATSSSSHNKSTQSNSHSQSANQNSHANGSRSSNSSISGEPSDYDRAELLKENSILRIRIDELTKLARKTENTLSDLMKKAEEQEEHWLKVVRTKDDQINTLQHSNGQQGI